MDSDALIGRIAAIIDRQKVDTYQGGIHPEDVYRLAKSLVAELGLYEEVDSAGRRSMRCDSRWEFPTITESGYAQVEQIVERAQELDQIAVAVTDHKNLVTQVPCVSCGRDLIWKDTYLDHVGAACCQECYDRENPEVE